MSAIECMVLLVRLERRICRGKERRFVLWVILSVREAHFNGGFKKTLMRCIQRETGKNESSVQYGSFEFFSSSKSEEASCRDSKNGHCALSPVSSEKASKHQKKQKS